MLGDSHAHARQPHDPSRSHPSRLEQRLPAEAQDRAGRDRGIRDQGRVLRPAHQDLDGGSAEEARPRLCQSCDRPGLCRRRQAGRCAQGHRFVAPSVGLGLDRQHSGLRPARRPVPRGAPASLELRPGLKPAMYGPGGRVPLRPFPGTIGVAPAAPGLHSIVPPRNVGGNMDVRDITAGVELYLPIEVDGALFSVGDTHAAQGDGEVCGTAIESPIDVALKFDLIKGAHLKMPRYVTPGPVSDHFDKQGYEVTTGIGPDLMTGARTAVMEMIELLAKRFGYSPIDAYMLCSVCADLRISSIVDVPNWVVSFYFPRIVLE